MPQRVRTATSSIPGGIRWQSGSPVPSTRVTNWSSTIQDFNDPGDCRPLDISSWEFKGGTINTPFNSATGTGFSSYVCDMLRSTSVPGPHLLNVTGVPSDVAAATSAAARTNPSRPYVDIPVDLLQIGELFHLIQQRGASLIRELARENLRYQFGIKPVVDDIVKTICRFHDQVDRRVREVNKLKTIKGLRRTVLAGQSSYAGSDLWVPQSNGLFFNARAHGLTSFTKKVHCRWLPTSDLSKVYTPDQMRLLIQRAVLGGTIDLSTVWQIIPWSWLIDWGANLGTFLRANRNIIPAQLTTCVVMLETKTVWQCPDVLQGSTKMDSIEITRRSRTRTTVSPSITAQFPFLDGNQVGILASLFAMKAKLP